MSEKGQTTDSSPPVETKRVLKIVFPLISLFFTLLFIYLIFTTVQDIIAGHVTANNIISLIIYCFLVFLIPMIFSPKNAHQLSIPKPPQNRNSKINIRLYRPMNLDHVKISSVIVKKCKKCGFENPGNTQICLNCGKDLDFL